MSTSTEVMQFILAARDNASATVRKVGAELNTLGPTAGGAAGPLQRLGAVTGGLISPMTLAVGGVTAFTAAAIASIGAASDLNEEIDKSKVVFGPAAEAVQEFAQNAANIGLSERAALGAAGAFGNMFRTTGLAAEQAGNMSTTMVQLAADMASFNNEDPSEMLDRLRSGLSGEAEPLRRFGVLLSEAAVKTFAYKEGIAASGAELTEAQKVQARYGLILEQTALQQGNFAATSGSLANLQRALGAEIENLAAKFGQALLPVAQVIVSFLAETLIPALSDLFDIIGPLIGIVAQLGSIAFLPLRAVLFLVSEAFSFLGSVLTGPFTAAWTFVQQMVGNVLNTIIEAGRNIVNIAASIPGPWQDAAKDIVAALDEAAATVDSWGDQTATAATAGSSAMTDFAGATTGAMGEAVPAVQEGAAAMGSALKAEIPAATDAVVADIRLLPRELADALVAGQTAWQEAWTQYKDILENDLTEGQEIARLRAQLTSRELVRGLQSGDAERRAAAEAMAKDIRDRLFALQNDVPELARKTGVSYADALEAQRTLVRAVGEDMAEDLRGRLNVNLRQGGVDTALSWVNGLQAGEVLNAAYQASAKIANIVRLQLEGQSPPREGPLHEIDRWGRNVAEAWAEGFASARIGDLVGRVTQAAVPGRLEPVARGGPRGGAGEGGLTVIFQSTFPPRPSDADSLARLLLPAIERERRRQLRSN